MIQMYKKKKEKNEKFYGREKLYRVNLWKRKTSKRSRREFYYRATQWLCACVCVGISVDVFHTEPVQSGTTLRVTSLQTQLHCKTISNAEKLGGPGAAPSSRFSVNKCSYVELKTEGGKWSRG